MHGLAWALTLLALPCSTHGFAAPSRQARTQLCFHPTTMPTRVHSTSPRALVSMALVNSGGWSQTEEEASNLKLESVQNALARIEADMSELDEPTDADSELSMTQRVLLGSAILSVLVFPSLGFTPHTVRWSSTRCPSRVPRTQPAARRVARPYACAKSAAWICLVPSPGLAPSCFRVALASSSRERSHHASWESRWWQCRLTFRSPPSSPRSNCWCRRPVGSPQPWLWAPSSAASRRCRTASRSERRLRWRRPSRRFCLRARSESR